MPFAVRSTADFRIEVRNGDGHHWRRVLDDTLVDARFLDCEDIPYETFLFAGTVAR